jgi:hypothetical protein
MDPKDSFKHQITHSEDPIEQCLTSNQILKITPKTCDPLIMHNAIQKHLQTIHNSEFQIKISLFSSSYGHIKVSPHIDQTPSNLIRRLCCQVSYPYSSSLRLILHPSNSTVTHLSFLKPNDTCRIITEEEIHKIKEKKQKEFEQVRQRFSQEIFEGLSGGEERWPGAVPLGWMMGRELEEGERKYFKEVDEKVYWWRGKPIYEIEEVKSFEKR